jgi:hypothetical protein
MADITELGNDVGQIASGVTEFAKQIGSELLAVACEGITALAEEQRHRAAEEIAAIGDALHPSAESLAGNSELSLDRHAEDASQYLGDLAQTVRSRPWGQLADDVEGLARAEPIAFVAATVGIGLLAGRFLLSTPPRRQGTGIGQMVPERPSEEANASAGAVPTDAIATAEGV